MEYLKFILYGLIQGLTEFVPVSSTAHLIVLSHFFGLDEPGHSLSAVIQFGSVLALIWYFKKDIFRLKSQSSRTFFDYFPNKRLLKSISVNTIPIMLLGGFIKFFVPNFFYDFFRSNLSIALITFIMTILMLVADNSKRGYVNLRNHKYSDSFLIGLSQAFAVFPGFSRSGLTISLALINGWERADAAKFSFLLGIPAISIAAIVEFISYFNEYSLSNFLPLIISLLSTFLSSLLAIDFLIKFYSSNGLKLFIIYRFIFCVVILLNL